mgnify:CR=1 FL=1|jgi:hypothetical protein
MGKVRQRLGKAYIHTKEESIQSIIIDALITDMTWMLRLQITEQETK